MLAGTNRTPGARTNLSSRNPGKFDTRLLPETSHVAKEEAAMPTKAQPRLRIRSTSYVVIPARLASTRLPRKLLLNETGKTLVQHTYEAATTASKPSGLCVAADHEEI